MDAGPNTASAPRQRTPAATFEGKPCEHGHTTRYLSNGKCVECERVYRQRWSADRQAERQARANGQRGVGGAPVVEGKPCKFGHTLVWVSNGKCVECEKERRRQDYAANPAKYKALDAAVHADPVRGAAKQKKTKEWKRAHPERVRQHTHKANVRYREKNRDVLREKNRAYEKANPEIKRASTRRRQAAQQKRVVSWSSKTVEKFAYWMAKAVEQITGEVHHVDHIIPLRAKNASGLHVPANLVVMPGELNARKLNNIDDRQMTARVPLLNTLEELRRVALDYPEIRAGLHRHEDAILELLELDAMLKPMGSALFA